MNAKTWHGRLIIKKAGFFLLVVQFLCPARKDNQKTQSRDGGWRNAVIMVFNTSFSSFISIFTNLLIKNSFFIIFFIKFRTYCADGCQTWLQRVEQSESNFEANKKEKFVHGADDSFKGQSDRESQCRSKVKIRRLTSWSWNTSINTDYETFMAYLQHSIKAQTHYVNSNCLLCILTDPIFVGNKINQSIDNPPIN